MLRMCDLKRRNPVPSPPVQLSPILTMRDIPRRAQIQTDIAAKQVEEQEVWRAFAETHKGHPNMSRSQPTPFHYVMRDGAWKGHRAFVVGGGASLRGFDWDLLKGELVIGVNRAFEKCSCSILFSMDLRLWTFYERGDLGEVAKERFGAYQGNRVWSVTPNFILPPEAYYVPRPKRGMGYGVGTIKELETANNSGYGAMQLAIALGAKPVYLLGFDMMGDGKGKQVWWHEGYPTGQAEGVYKGMVEHFNAFASNTKGRGLDVINLSKNSALRCFRKQDVGEVLAQKVCRPVVVSFYTENTGYEREAARLVESLHRFGLEYDVEARPNMGGWKKNNDYKPSFILEMMEKHKGRDIVWLDSDAVVMAYPELWDDAKIKLGVHTVDWSRYVGRETWNKKEMLAGTIYLGNTPQVRTFVKGWIQRMITHPKATDQQNLEALAKGKDWVTQLPATYCQIFDTMASAGEPVVEHGQASRRLKKEVGA